MVTMTSADKALKTLYLGAITEQLNTEVNPLLAKIKQSTADVWGKEIRRVARYGINGGIGAGSETGDLPKAEDAIIPTELKRTKITTSTNRPFDFPR